MRILFFSPYAFVNVWAYPEAVLAENFRRRGHEVVQVRCDGLYSDFCISMSAINLTPRSSELDRLAVCRDCQGRRDRIAKQFGFETLYLDKYVSAQDRALVDSQLEMVSPENWTEVKFEGIPIPRFAAYEYLLNEKICTTSFEPEQWAGFMTHVKNALLTARAGHKLLDEVEPDAILAYNTNYGCNHVMCALAEARDIPHFKEHQGRHHKQMLSEMTIFRGHTDNALVNRCDAWRKLRDRPLSSSAVQLAYEHIAELLQATSPWVYSIKSDKSSPETLRAFFGINDQKIALVTMSSADEYFAAHLVGVLAEPEAPMFPTQNAWIQSLLDWARERPDIFLLIRVHPREFPNKRENVLSTNARTLKETLTDLPPNCKVNWPDDGISIHDIAKITNVCLNATSTVGLEMLLFGIPVIIYNTQQFIAYPAELNSCAHSIERYWLMVDEALHAGHSADHIVGAFRWLAFLSTVVAIDIGDVYGTHFAQAWAAPHAAHRNRLMKIMDKLLGRQIGSEPSPPLDDHFLNPRGIPAIKNSKWLAYAVEHRVISHMDALADEVLHTTKMESSDAESAAIEAMARRYFNDVGFSTSVFDDRIRQV